ncbi:unnamed protein product [Ectocarpus sp. 12 AP-2014]
MFLGAVARPQSNVSTGSTCSDFDGKIGTYPFTEKVRAQNSSRNKERGTLETKTVEVTKERYRRMMIDHVIPDIKSKFPPAPAAASPEGRTIWVC